MCGITAILLADSTTRDISKIQDLFTANLVANEIRGKDATGILIVQNNGSWFLEKAPLPASEFTKTSAYTKLLSRADRDTVLLLGHTRNPTKGSPTDNNNNHPIIVGDTIGVHNGTLSNDDEIFLQHLKAGKDSRIGAVDSEAIFALIDELGRNNSMERYCDKLSQMSQLLHGSYTTIYTRPEDPFRLYLLKYNNPMSVHYSPEHQGLFFSSRYIFLRKAFGRSVITEALPSRQGFVFDSTLITNRGKRPILCFPLAQQDDMLD